MHEITIELSLENNPCLVEYVLSPNMQETLTKLPLENNPCLVELILNPSEVQHNCAFDENWRYIDKEQLDEKIQLFEQANIYPQLCLIHRLVKQGKVSDPIRLLYLFKIELPAGLQRQGCGTDAISQLVYWAKNVPFPPYEYLITTAINSEAVSFFRELGFEPLDKEDNYWGWQL